MQLFINNWSAVLTAPATASAVSLFVPQADAAKLAGLGGDDHYLLTLAALDGSGIEAVWEVVKVTASASGVLTVQRGQEGTIARAWPAAAPISARLTAGVVAELVARPVQPGVPPGGSAGQMLSKASSDNFNVAWVTPPAAQPGVPPGGSAGQVLSKASSDNFNVAWVTPPAAQPGVPPGGSAGQVLSKASSDNFNVAWITPPTADGGWIAAPLLNGWVDYGAGAQPTQYRRIGSRVDVRGGVKDGSTSIIFVLPAGFRPLHDQLPPCVYQSGSLVGGALWVAASSGEVSRSAEAMGNVQIQFNFSFYLD